LRLVGVDLVVESKPDEIRLRSTTDDLSSLRAFHPEAFIETLEPDMAGVLLQPFAVAEEPFDRNGRSAGPAELALERGASVRASDGVVGKVSEFLVDPVDGRITHLVLSQGHLWGGRDVTIGIGHILHIDEESVSLDLSKKEIGALPALRVRRWLPV
jgi:hypothetical protein